MITSYFENDALRRYVVVFGTLFNNIYIQRNNDASTKAKVPISYGPREKFLSRKDEDPDFERNFAVRLPRLSFEITGMAYAPNRKFSTLNQLTSPGTDAQRYQRLWSPVPYDINFQLSVMAKTIEDGNKIVEQILPYFTPDWTVAMNPLADVTIPLVDIPIVLNSVNPDDQYEADYTVRRTMVWTLDFTMKAYFYGPTSEAKIIKIAKIDVHPNFDPESDFERISVSPGLTANGEPTSNGELSISYLDINETDDYGYVIDIEYFPNVEDE